MFQKRVILKDFLEARARSREFQNVDHSDAHTANARAAAALTIVYRDAIQALRLHSSPGPSLQLDNATHYREAELAVA